MTMSITNIAPFLFVAFDLMDPHQNHFRRGYMHNIMYISTYIQLTKEKMIKQEKLEISQKKIGDIRRTFHEKIDMIKDRNSKSLMRHKRLSGGNNTEELYQKKVLMMGITNGVILT